MRSAVSMIARLKLFYGRGQFWVGLLQASVMFATLLAVLHWSLWLVIPAVLLVTVLIVLAGYLDARFGVWQAENQMTAMEQSPPWKSLMAHLEKIERAVQRIEKNRGGDGT